MVESFVEFAVVVAVGGVGGADVAVAGFEEFKDATFVDYAGSAVVGQGSEEDAVASVLGVEGAELAEVFTQEHIGLGFGKLAAFAIWFTGQDSVTVTHIGPIFRMVQSLIPLDYQDGSLK